MSVLLSLLLALGASGALLASAAPDSGDQNGPPVLNLSSASDSALTLQQGVNGYAGANDAYLDNNFPARRQGSLDIANLRISKGQQNVLVRFDLSSLPPGVQVVSANLQLWSYYADNSTPTLVEAYQVLRAWTDIEATWIESQSGQPWVGPGCSSGGLDRTTVPLDTRTLSTVNRWYSFDVTGAVRQWTNGWMPNHGLLLLASSVSNHHALRSSDWLDVDQRPKLEIVYQVPTATPTDTQTATPSATATQTLTFTPGTPTSSPTVTPTATLGDTPTTTLTPTETITPTVTATATTSATPTVTNTPTATPTPTPTFTPIPIGEPQTYWFRFEESPNPWYRGAVDTYLDRNDEWVNFNSSDTLRVNYDGRERALVRFDLSLHIPVSATVTYAELVMYSWYNDYPGTKLELAVYEVRRNWMEGAANWLECAPPQRWGLPGCDDASDRASQPIISATLRYQNSQERWENDDLLGLVQHWVSDPDSNRGLLLVGGPQAAQQRWYFCSAEFGESAEDRDKRPALRVGFVVGGPTRTPTATPTRTQTATASATPTSTATATASATATPSLTPTGTATATTSPTPTHTGTPTPTGTATTTPSATPTPTETTSPTATMPATDTPTATLSPSPTTTGTPEATATLTPVATPTETPSQTATIIPTETGTPSPTATITPTATRRYVYLPLVTRRRTEPLPAGSVSNERSTQRERDYRH
jgi:hypothetical protein